MFLRTDYDKRKRVDNKQEEMKIKAVFDLCRREKVYLT